MSETQEALNPECELCVALVEAGYDPVEVEEYHDAYDKTRRKFANDPRVQQILIDLDNQE